MTDPRFHSIDEYLAEDWIDAWTADVVADVEQYLAKHAAFEAFLTDGSPPPPAAEA